MNDKRTRVNQTGSIPSTRSTKNTNRRQRGAARGRMIPDDDSYEGRLFSPDTRGRCSPTVVKGEGRPGGAIPPTDLAGIGGGRRAEPVAGGGGRRWGKGRGLKCPSHQLLRYDTGHRRGEAETHKYADWGRVFAAPFKKFCWPAAFAGSVRAGFFAPTRILTVILRIGTFCEVC